MSSVSEELKELEEYARQFEANTARNSGRDSVMTVTSSGGSYSAGDTLRPLPTFTSHRAGLPSLPPVLASSQHTEQRDGSHGNSERQEEADSESISAELRNAEGNCSTLQQSCSISDRITRIQRLARPAPATSVVRTRLPPRSSIPSLSSSSSKDSSSGSRSSLTESRIPISKSQDDLLRNVALRYKQVF